MIFLSKNNYYDELKNKNKNKDDKEFDNSNRGNNNIKNTNIIKGVIDLRSYIAPDMERLDENGSYTGITKPTYYENELEVPIQDADDL